MKNDDNRHLITLSDFPWNSMCENEKNFTSFGNLYKKEGRKNKRKFIKRNFFCVKVISKDCNKHFKYGFDLKVYK